MVNYSSVFKIYTNPWYYITIQTLNNLKLWTKLVITSKFSYRDLYINVFKFNNFAPEYSIQNIVIINDSKFKKIVLSRYIIIYYYEYVTIFKKQYY